MTTLVDWQIQRLADLNKGIQPFHKRQLNPASYNLRIGNKGIIETPDGRTEVSVSTRYVSNKRPRWLWAILEAMVCHSFHRHILRSMRRAIESH